MTRREGLPSLCACVCGSISLPALRRRGSKTHLQALECRLCGFRSAAAGHPAKIHANWNRDVAERRRQLTKVAHG
jgi:hypothetical protein